MDPEDADNWRSLDYIHDQIAEQLKQQYDLWDIIDGRLRLILGVISVIFAVSVGFQRSQSQLALPVGLLAIVAILIYLLAGILVSIAYWPRNFNWPPKPAGLRGLILKDPRETKLEVIDSIIEAYNHNAGVIERKILFFKIAFVLTALATVCLSAAVISNIWSQTTDLGAPPPTATPIATPAANIGGTNEPATP